MDARNFDNKLGWREALGFEHPIKGWQHLWIRFATDQDVKKEDTKGENSRFYRFATRTSQQRGRGSHSSHRPHHSGRYDRDDRRDRGSSGRITKKAISKPEKYRDNQRKARKYDKDSDDESSDFENSGNGKKG